MTHQSQDDNTYEQIIEQPHTTAFSVLKIIIFLAHDEPPTWITNTDQISHPTNLTSSIPIIPLFAFPPPDFPSSNVTSGNEFRH